MKKVIIIASAIIALLVTLYTIVQVIRTAYIYDIYYMFYILGLGDIWGLLSVFWAITNLLAMFIALKVLFCFKISGFSEKLLMFATRILLLLSSMTIGSATYKLFKAPATHIIPVTITNLACLAIIITLFTYFVRTERLTEAKKKK